RRPIVRGKQGDLLPSFAPKVRLGDAPPWRARTPILPLRETECSEGRYPSGGKATPAPGGPAGLRDPPPAARPKSETPVPDRNRAGAAGRAEPRTRRLRRPR